MIKIILPNKKIHSFSYNQDAPIKEILAQFYAKKGLLADIYELDDSKMNVPIDDNKSPRDYNLNSLNLRRVKEPNDSLENEFQTMVSNGDYDKYPRSPSSGKPNRFQFWKPKANRSPKKDHANSFSVMPLNHSNEDPYQNATLGKKQKRQAPLPPISSDQTAANLFEHSVQDVCIPSPPPIRDLPPGTRPSFTWLTDASTTTDTFSDIYGSIHSFISEYSFSSSTSISKQREAFTQRNNEYKDNRKSIPLLYASNSSSINSPIATETTNEDDFSDPELHEYATIPKRVNENVTDVQIPNNSISVDAVDYRLSGISLKGDVTRKPRFNIIHNKSENQNLPLENNERKNTEGAPKSAPVTSEKPTSKEIHEVVHEIQIPKPACVNDNDKITDYKELQEIERTVASANVPESNLNREASCQGPPITISKPRNTIGGKGKNVSEISKHSSSEEGPSLNKPRGTNQENHKPVVIVNNSKEVNKDLQLPEMKSKEVVEVDQESDNRGKDLTSGQILDNSLTKDRLRCFQKPPNKSLFFTAN